MIHQYYILSTVDSDTYNISHNIYSRHFWGMHSAVTQFNFKKWMSSNQSSLNHKFQNSLPKFCNFHESLEM